MLTKIEDHLEATAKASKASADRAMRALSVLSVRTDHTGLLPFAVGLLEHVLLDLDGCEVSFHAMALAIRQYALLPPSAPHEISDEIWESVGLKGPR
jgi:hypothetical protein